MYETIDRGGWLHRGDTVCEIMYVRDDRQG